MLSASDESRQKPGSPPAARHILLVLLSVYAVTVVTHLWLLWPGAQFPHISSDESQYVMTGENLRRGNGYVLRGEFNASAPPMIPSVIALAHSVGDFPRLSMFVTASFLMCAAIFPAFLLARRIGLGFGESVLLSAAAGFLPHTMYAATYMTEVVNYPLGLVAAYLAVRWLESPSRQISIWLGVCLGAMLLTKVAAINIVLAFLAAAIAGTIRRYRAQSDHRSLWAVHTSLVFAVIVAVAGLWLLFKQSHQSTALGLYGNVLREQGLPHFSVSLMLAYLGDYFLAAGLVVAAPIVFWFNRAWGEHRDRAVFFACALAIPFFAVSILDGGLTGQLRERLLTNYLPILTILAVSGLHTLRERKSLMERLLLPAFPVVLLGWLVLYPFHTSPVMETPWAHFLGAFTGRGVGLFSIDRLIFTTAIVAIAIGVLLLKVTAARSGLVLAAFVLSFHTGTLVVTAKVMGDWTTIGLRFLSPIAQWLDNSGLKPGDRLLVSGRRNYFESRRTDVPSDGFFLDWTWQLGLSEILVWQLEAYSRYDVRMIPSPHAIPMFGKSGDYFLATTLMEGPELVGSHAPLYLYRIRDSNRIPKPLYSTSFGAEEFFTMAGRRSEPGTIGGKGSGQGDLDHGLYRTLPQGQYRVKFQVEGSTNETVGLEVMEGDKTLARAAGRTAAALPLTFSTTGRIPIQFRVSGTGDSGFRFGGIAIDYVGAATTGLAQPAGSPQSAFVAEFSETAPALDKLRPETISGCFIDKLNSQPSSQRVSLDRDGGLQLEGWIADTTAGEVLPTVVVELSSVELTSAASAHYYAHAPRNARPDVAVALKKPSLGGAGFSLNAKLAPLPNGLYSVKLIQTNGKKAQVCEVNRTIDLR